MSEQRKVSEAERWALRLRRDIRRLGEADPADVKQCAAVMASVQCSLDGVQSSLRDSLTSLAMAAFGDDMVAKRITNLVAKRAAEEGTGAR